MADVTQRPSALVALVPAEPEPTVSATVAALIHGYSVSKPRPDVDRFEVITVLERPRAES